MKGQVYHAALAFPVCRVTRTGPGCRLRQDGKEIHCIDAASTTVI
jgi:hypothetical protein